jgi:acyl transferase domain-containing protein
MKLPWKRKRKKLDDKDIAIIGIVGRFPKSPSVDLFWKNLSEGKELITFFTDEELLEAGIPQELLFNPQYVKASPILEDYDKFDANFFKFSRREAELLDPQQRM